MDTHYLSWAQKFASARSGRVVAILATTGTFVLEATAHAAAPVRVSAWVAGQGFAAYGPPAARYH
jgi:hypothetical protein